MIGYASHTGTKRNLAALREARWGVILSPFGDWYDVDLRHAIDNPAWPVSQKFKRGERPSRRPTVADLALWWELVEARGADADFIIVPDIVLGGMDSLDLSADWLPRLRQLPPGPKLLIAVQDGMECGRLNRAALQLVGQADGIFVGGGDPWKEQALPCWAALKRDLGCYLHVGRVNTSRRIALCAAAKADSFDGTSATRFARNLPKLEQAARQPSLLGFGS